MLRETDLMGVTHDKVQRAIDRLRAFEPPEGYYVAFSGGKDSQCIYHLCKQAGVKFDAHYSVTSVDPPELVRFIREQYPDVLRDIPHDKNGEPITIWNLIVKKGMPPTRLTRYCCQELKETKGAGRLVVTGVRWAESANRAKRQGIVNTLNGLTLNDDNTETRRYVEQCYRTRKTLINPIVDWSTADVWEYLNDVAKVPHCSLYDEGFKRLGCIGCPLAGPKKQRREFERWPAYYTNYLRAFGRMIENLPPEKRRNNFSSAQAVMDWWLRERSSEKPLEGQIDMWEGRPDGRGLSAGVSVGGERE